MTREVPPMWNWQSKNPAAMVAVGFCLAACMISCRNATDSTDTAHDTASGAVPLTTFDERISSDVRELVISPGGVF